MSHKRTGFTPLKIASLVAGGIAIIFHITAVAYQEWDGIDAQWHPSAHVPITLPVKAYGSLWDFTLVKDRTRKMFFDPSLQHLTDTVWKTPIILMATTGIGFGILGEGLMILAALLIKCTTRVGVHVCVKMLATTSILCASFECLMGAILYRDNYTKKEAPKDLNYNQNLPYDEYVLRAGFFSGMRCRRTIPIQLITLHFG